MKRISLFLALLATTSFAYQTDYEERSQQYSPVRFGVDVGGIFTIPSLWPSYLYDAKMGLGFRVVPGVEYSITSQFDLRAFAGYQFTTWGYRFVSSDGSTDDYSLRTQFLTFGLAGQFDFPRRGSFASMGVSTDIPLRSDFTDDFVDSVGAPGTSSGHYRNDQPAVFLDFGLGHQISPLVGLVLGYRLPLSPFYDQGGSTIDLHQIDVGLRFTLP